MFYSVESFILIGIFFVIKGGLRGWVRLGNLFEVEFEIFLM